MTKHTAHRQLVEGALARQGTSIAELVAESPSIRQAHVRIVERTGIEVSLRSLYYWTDADRANA